MTHLSENSPNQLDIQAGEPFGILLHYQVLIRVPRIPPALEDRRTFLRDNAEGEQKMDKLQNHRKSDGLMWDTTRRCIPTEI